MIATPWNGGSSPLPSGEDLRRGTLFSARFRSRAIQDFRDSELRAVFDFVEHFVRVCQHPLIPEAQDPVALRLGETTCESRPRQIARRAGCHRPLRSDFFQLNRNPRSTDQSDVGGGTSRCTCACLAGDAKELVLREFAHGAICGRSRKMLRTRAWLGMLQFRKERQGTERTRNIESRAKRALNKVPHLKSSPIGRGERIAQKLLRFVFFLTHSLFLCFKPRGQTREGV